MLEYCLFRMAPGTFRGPERKKRNKVLASGDISKGGSQLGVGGCDHTRLEEASCGTPGTLFPTFCLCKLSHFCDLRTILFMSSFLGTTESCCKSLAGYIWYGTEGEGGKKQMTNNLQEREKKNNNQKKKWVIRLRICVKTVWERFTMECPISFPTKGYLYYFSQ